MKVLALGDVHLPYPHWRALEKVALWNEHFYKADVIVQSGDFIDAHSWSTHQKYQDSPSPDHEWARIEKAAYRFHQLFDPKTVMYILEGNHDRRHQLRALEARIPSQLVAKLSEKFDYAKNWNWWVNQRPLTLDRVDYIHGDEQPGRADQKAGRCGHSIVQGHLHVDAGIRYIDTFHYQLFGMDLGCLMDTNAIAARYASKRLLRSFIGWGTVEDGVPHLWPWEKMKSWKPSPARI